MLSQAPARPHQQRRDPRRPVAFSFWFQPVDSARQSSGWMLNLAPGGAAFLTAAENAPPTGARIALREMYSHDRVVREGNPPLPAFARVLRVDREGGVTRRVAVRFELDVPALNAPGNCRHAAMVCHDRHPGAIPPPLSRETLNRPAISRRASL